MAALHLCSYHISLKLSASTKDTIKLRIVLIDSLYVYTWLKIFNDWPVNFFPGKDVTSQQDEKNPIGSLFGGGECLLFEPLHILEVGHSSIVSLTTRDTASLKRGRLTHSHCPGPPYPPVQTVAILTVRQLFNWRRYFIFISCVFLAFISRPFCGREGIKWRQLAPRPPGPWVWSSKLFRKSQWRDFWLPFLTTRISTLGRWPFSGLPTHRTLVATSRWAMNVRLRFPPPPSLSSPLYLFPLLPPFKHTHTSFIRIVTKHCSL